MFQANFGLQKFVAAGIIQIGIPDIPNYLWASAKKIELMPTKNLGDESLGRACHK
jgi:hypothetical protein